MEGCGKEDQIKNKIIKTKRNHERFALYKTAHICYVVAIVLLGNFIYSFLVQPGCSFDGFTRALEENHHSFVFGGRWYFLTGSVVAVIMALLSIRKDNFPGNTVQEDK